MATKDAEMKIKVNSDTSGLKKEMNSAKSAVKDFQRTTTGALGEIGNAFGVNIGKVSQVTNAVKGLGVQMQSSGNAGVQAFGKLLASTSKLASGIAGIGIAAAVAGFKQLNAQAENFKQTLAGANIELQTQAYLATYRQAMHDMQDSTGKSVAEAGSKLKEIWGSFTAQIGAHGGAIVSNMLGLTDISWGDVDDQAVKAIQAANRSKEIQQEIFTIQRQQKDNLVTIAELDARIAEARERASDADLSSQQRLDAINTAAALVREKYSLQSGLATELAKKMKEMNDLTDSTPAQIDAANQAEVTAVNLRAQEANELRSLNKLQASLTANVEKEREAARAIADSRASLADWASKSGVSGTMATGLASTSAGMGLVIRPVLDEKALTDISHQLESTLTSLAESTSSIIGELVGDLATGGDAWSNFSNSAVSAFGDMAISVGKMAIATGVATLGIKKALESLNGYVAIAAGAALVALGSAVKAGMSNIASGNYSGGGSVASGGYSASSAGGYSTSAISVNVTGKLVAQGSQLVAVINNENNRKDHTS